MSAVGSDESAATRAKTRAVSRSWWGTLGASLALMLLWVELRYPAMIRAALDSDVPISSIIMALFSLAMVATAFRRGRRLEVLPGALLLLVYGYVLVRGLR